MKEQKKKKTKATTTAEREARKNSPKKARTENQKKLHDERLKAYNGVKKEFQEHMNEVAKESKKKYLRPRVPYDKELAEEICYLIGNTTDSLDKILNSDDRFPSYVTIYEWIDELPVFSKMYSIAKQRQAHNHVDKLMKVAEDDSKDLLFTVEGEKANTAAIARAKLRIDTAKWIVGKVLPKVYGDKLFNETQITVVKHEDFLSALE